MTAARSLTFFWTPWSITLATAMVVAAAILSFVAWRRSGWRKSIGMLELLRLGLVVLIGLLLNQPEWVEEYRPNEKPTIVVLLDDSGSMATRDVAKASDPPSAGAPMISRRELIAPLADPAAWDALREKFQIEIQSIASGEPRGGSNLYAPLAQAAGRYGSLAGVVLASDGDWNEGPPPVQAAAELQRKGVPVFALPIGSSTQLPDVELLSFDVPTFGVADKLVRIPFTIESSLPRDFNTSITLRASNGDEVSKDIRIAAMGRTSDWIQWKSSVTGDYTLELVVPRHGDETLDDNNRLSAPLAIREERLRVLLVESYPRWEYRYLRNALSRDPGVEVSCLLFHPGLSQVGGGNKDYIKQFPSGLDELAPFDVVFLGDVGVDDGQLTPDQCRLIKGLVEHQASGLVFMPGWQGRQFSLLDTELRDLYPVILDESQSGGWGSRTAGQFELTESGRRSLLTRLADTQDDNAEVWEGLPGFQWYAPTVRSKAGSEVLAVHQEMSNEHGRLPLLVTRTFGAGKVLFMGTDGAWRWRKGVEDKYHYRFWGQVVRWMAYQRNMAAGEQMRLYYAPDQPQLRQTLALHALVMARGGEPLANGDVTARIVAPSGKLHTVRLAPSRNAGDEWGVFLGQFTTVESGKHQVTLWCQQTGATLETSFFVQPAAVERIGKPARPEVMEELARVSRGKVIEQNRMDEVIQSLAELPEPRPIVRRIQLWSHPVFAAGLVFLMGVFWIGRKAVGLV